MKRIILSGLLGLLVFPAFVFAGGNRPGLGERITPTVTPTFIGVEEAVARVFNTGFWILLVISAIFFLMGAFYFLLGGTDPENVKKGKSVITYAIIALVIAIVSLGLAEFVPRIFNIQAT